MEDLLKGEQVTIGVLDQQAWGLLEETREAHAEANLCVFHAYDIRGPH
jgi:hypothetical protein